MTLKEKIEEVKINKGMANELEKIVDDYAIEFVRWCFDNENAKEYYIKALREFKKEKGL